MGDGGQHNNFHVMVAQLNSFSLWAPLDDVTARYHLLPEFPFKTAELLFNVAADEGAGGSAEIVVAPMTKHPLEDEDLLGEILCRLPPLPSPLAGACLVSRFWARLGASAAFRRLLHDHHRRPPVVGVYEKSASKLVFIPALDAPNRVPPERFSLRICADHATDYWSVLGCRQGRVLVVNRTRAEILVFDPVSGDRRLVAFPPDFVNHASSTNGALVVDDKGQSPSAFKVVLVGVSRVGAPAVWPVAELHIYAPVAVRVFSSATGVWGDLVSTPELGRVGRLPSTLIGNSLYWWLAEPKGAILRYDLGTQMLTMIHKPEVPDINIGCSRIIRSEDGGLGLAVLSYPAFCLYDRKVDSDGVTAWPLRKVVRMDDLLDLPAVMQSGRTYIVGYAEEADAMVLSVYTGTTHTFLYIIQLNSMQHKKLEDNVRENAYYPFAGFYIYRRPVVVA